MKHKVGDKVVITGNISSHSYKIGEVAVITDVSKEFGDCYYCNSAVDSTKRYFLFDDEFEEYQETPITQDATGGPSLYYDMPYATWVTTNDQMEYLAEHKWGKYAIHLKDIFKGLCRWGDKQGTTPNYDARKIIYYGLRVLMMLEGKANVQKYLSDLKNDPQFKESK